MAGKLAVGMKRGVGRVVVARSFGGELLFHPEVQLVQIVLGEYGRYPAL
jgi:hypothetical protein